MKRAKAAALVAKAYKMDIWDVEVRGFYAFGFWYAPKLPLRI